MTASAPLALVTGASRGIGAATARLLAARGWDVAINYRSKGSRAADVAAQITALGQQAQLLQADLTSAIEREGMAQSLRAVQRQLNLLILNASGGMEKDKPETYAMDLNHTAQVATVSALLPLMPPGSTIVFVTSHWAHFYGQQPVLSAYESVARSKQAGENALRARQDELAHHGVRLLVVSGDVIEGTITPKLLDRAQPGVIQQRRDQTGALPTIEEFARAIVEAAINPALGSGATIYVGATE